MTDEHEPEMVRCGFCGHVHNQPDFPKCPEIPGWSRKPGLFARIWAWLRTPLVAMTDPAEIARRLTVKEDMPERIWAFKFNSDWRGGHFRTDNRYPMDARERDAGAEYIRIDTPLRRAVAKELEGGE